MDATTGIEILARTHFHHSGSHGGHASPLLVIPIVLAVMIAIAVYAYRRQSRSSDG